MASFFLLKTIRKLPGTVIKLIPKPAPRLIEGYGKRAVAGEICADNGYINVLLVTDATLAALGYYKAVEEVLIAKNINFRLFSDISSEPNVSVIENGINAAIACNADCIIALGGGSVLDCSKMIAAGAKMKRRSVKSLLRKFLFVRGGTLPIISIPSTAGTGAEFTVGAMVTGDKGAKGATVLVGLKVTDVIQDCELTVNAPRRITAACGIDALSHGLEGAVASVRVSAEDERKSKECVRLVLENLPIVLDDPGNIDARQKMCLAAFYGGNAINEQLAGYVHAFAHSIGAMYHIPHGNAIAASLLPVMEYQKDKCADKLADIARYCGLAGKDDNDFTATDRLLASLAELIDKCDFAKDLCIHKKDYKELGKRISNDTINYSPPVVMRKSDINAILDNISGQ